MVTHKQLMYIYIYILLYLICSRSHESVSIVIRQRVENVVVAGGHRREIDLFYYRYSSSPVSNWYQGPFPKGKMAGARMFSKIKVRLNRW
jgi:hypothetical protein